MSVTLTIDGLEADIKEGTTILEAARSMGIEIPHFCYHPCLSIPANCRMCLVEVEKSPRLLPACHAKVAAGMTVHTSNDRVLKARQAIMEFLFVNHPVDCPVCDQSGECKLQDYFMAWQKRLSRFGEKKVAKSKAVPIGPRVVYDAERCILCTRCIRFMKEIAGDPQLCTVERGDHAYISTAPGSELDHPYSMNTVDICPVGALTSRDFRFKKRVWFLKSVRSVCPGCARGCSILVQHHNGTVHRYLPRENPQVNDVWLCDDGRLSYRRLNDDRLTGCVITSRTHATHRPSPETASKAAADLLQRYNGRITLIVSPQLTCEEAWAMLRFSRDILGVAGFFISGKPGWSGDDLLRLPDADPNRRGLREIADAVGITYKGITQGSLNDIGADSLLLVAGEDLPCPIPADKFGALIVLSSHVSGMAGDADIALPLAAFSEQEGTFVNADGLIQRLRSTGIAKGDSIPAWRWVTYLEWAVGREPSYRTAEEVFSEMAGGAPFFAGSSHKSIGPAGVFGAGATPPEGGRLCKRR